MKNLNYARLAGALLSALALFSLTLQAAEKSNLYGTVSDPLGALVAGAKVELLRDGKAVSSATTDNAGRYSLAVTTAGRYRVRATAAGFAPRTTPQLYAGSGDHAEINLVLSIGVVAQEVVVSSSGTEVPQSQSGASISVVSREDLDRSLDAVDSLREIAGVQALRSGREGTASSMFIRGAESNAAKVLLDGVPVNNIGGVANFGILSSSGIEQAELLRGPNSVLYGADALAGVVSLTTRRGLTPLPELTYSFDAGNFGQLRHDASLGGAYRQFDYFGNYSRFDTSNGLPNSRFHNSSASINFGWTPNAGTDIRVTARHTDTALGVAGQIEFFGIPDDSQQRDQDSYISVTAQNQTTERWHNLVRYGASRLRTQFDNPTPTGIPFDPFGFGPNFLGNTVTIKGANGFSTTGQAILDFGGVFPSLSSSSAQRDFIQAQSDYTFNRHLLALFGFRYENERGFTFAADTRTPTRRSNFTWTSELQGSLWGRAYATVGVGVEDNAVFGVAATPRVSLAYYLFKPHSQGAWSGTKLKFNYGQGIKEPTIFEETSSLFGLLSQLPNGPALISQFHVRPIGAVRSRSFDAGVEQGFGNGRGKLGLTFFHNRFNDQVEFVSNTALPQLGVPDPVAAQTPFGATVNSEDTRALGAETELSFDIGHGFRARATYTYLDAVVKRSFSSDALFPSFNPAFPDIPIGAFSPLVGNRPFRRAPHTGSFLVLYSKSRTTLSVSGYLSSRRDDSTFLSDSSFGSTMLLPNRNLAPAFQKIDFNAGYRLNSMFSLEAAVENLGSEHYDEAFGFPALPLTFRTGVKIRLGGESWRMKP